MTMTSEPGAATAGRRSLALTVESDVAIITIDQPGEAVNKLTFQTADELMGLLSEIDSHREVRGVVLISGKTDGFIAGADIDQFLEVRTAADAQRLSREAHRSLDRLEQYRLPVVVAIHGACMGGGLELALACHHRIVTDHPKTILALPEVQLGLIPGAGGTQRLPKVVGLRNALDMILTGKNVRAKKALSIGLADEMVHPAVLRQVALARARELGSGSRRTRRRRRDPATVVLEQNPLGRSVVFRQAREQTLKKTRGHYPAPLAALEAVQASYGDRDHGFATEARLFGEMALTEVSRQLIFLFYASTALKKDPGIDVPGVEPREVKNVAILGAGFMGAGIAAVTAMQDVPVRFKDTALDRVGTGLRSVRTVLKEQLDRRRITRREFEDRMSLVSGTIEYSGFGNADLIIEAVFEDLDVKHAVVRDVEPFVPEHAIIASNTSTIPIALIAQASRRPRNVIGMHFFSPVHKMPLLEVIVTPDTDPEVTATVVGFGKRLGKTVIVVNDAPGFYANRILTPYINEAGKLLDEGVSVEALDRALVEFGFPVGPVTLIDEVGLDVAGKAGQVMTEAFPDRMTPSESLRRVIESGRTGRKGKKGFYLYDEGGKKQGVDESVYELLPTGTRRSEVATVVMRDRTVLAMVNEAVHCLEEGIVRSPRDGDIGAVFGIGFPPFRGGPFRYVDTVGAASMLRRLEELDERHPGRYTPAPLLRDMAQRGARFYPEKGRPVD